MFGMEVGAKNLRSVAIGLDGRGVLDAKKAGIRNDGYVRVDLPKELASAVQGMAKASDIAEADEAEQLLDDGLRKVKSQMQERKTKPYRMLAVRD